MTFFVSAPIFVFREFMRHRIASYNEESGRYRELRPVFYIPSAERKLIQVGKTGAYTFVDGTKEQFDVTVAAMKDAYVIAYDSYQKMLEAGVAREVARVVLPVATYSSMYVSMNARALMNFLSLRLRVASQCAVDELTPASAIAGTFVARGWAGYSPRWRSHYNDEPFARRDKRYYSPYSLLLGVSYLALLAGEMER